MTTSPATHDIADPSNETIDRLADVVGREHVLSSRADRLAYNADCSPRGIILARGRRLEASLPTLIVQPGNREEVAAVVEAARGLDLWLIPYGAGSGVCRGAVAGAGDSRRAPNPREVVIVDLKRMSGIERVDSDAGLARVGAGMIGEHFETELNRLGWTAGHFPSSIYCSSIGGWVAARSAGQCSSRYGKIEDMVASLEVVTGRGDVVETTPEAGVARRHESSDLSLPTSNPTQLFVGNEGTLSLITAATLRVEPAPTEHAYRGFHLPGIDAGLAAIRDVMQSGLRPSVVRLYDPADTLVKGGGTEGADSSESGEDSKGGAGSFERLCRSLPDPVGRGLQSLAERGVRGLRSAALRRLAAHPSMVNAAADRLGSKCLLILGFDGRDRLIKREAEVAFDAVRSHGEDLGEDPGEKWREHRYDASYKQSPVFEAGAFVDTMEISAPWGGVERLYHAVRRALGRHALVMGHFSHVYREGSSIYFTFLGGGEDTDEALRIYERAWRDALDAAADVGGSIAHHHGVGAEKAPWTGCDHRGGRRVFHRIKRRLDPDRVMNPGKVYPGVAGATDRAGRDDRVDPEGEGNA